MQRFSGPGWDVWLLWGYTGVSGFVQRGAGAYAEDAAVKVLCSRCGAVVAHLNALLGHYQEVHGGVPKPRFFCPDGCNTSATGTPEAATLAQEKLFTCVRECYDVGATHTSGWSEPVPSSTIRNRPLSTPRCVCSNSLQLAERGPFCGS